MSSLDKPDRLTTDRPAFRDSAEQRALRLAFNARLDQLQQDVLALVRFCPEKDQRVGTKLLELARCLVRDSKLAPGDVAAIASASKKDKRQTAWSDDSEGQV